MSWFEITQITGDRSNCELKPAIYWSFIRAGGGLELESFKNAIDYLGFIVLSIKYHVLNGSMNKFNVLDDSAMWYD